MATVEERVEAIAETATATGRSGYTLDLRVYVYPDRETQPGGCVHALDRDGRLGPGLVLSHVGDNGPVLDWIVQRVRAHAQAEDGASEP